MKVRYTTEKGSIEIEANHEELITVVAAVLPLLSSPRRLDDPANDPNNPLFDMIRRSLDDEPKS